jgi:hypothetical protein
MSDYRELIKTEAKKFFDANRADFEADAGEHGGKSAQPNFSRWLDRTIRLNKVVEGISAKWTHKDFLWVKNNTRNKDPKGGGDPRSVAYGSFYLDLLHEVKKHIKKD